MSDEGAAAPAAIPDSEASADTGANTGGEVDTSVNVDASNDTGDVVDTGAKDISDAGEAGTEAGDFAVPEDYKDKLWLEKYKFESTEDVFKALDNAQELIGKKTIAPIDYNNASDDQISEYHKSIVPEDVTAYKFSDEADPEFSSAITPALQESGIHPAQLKILEPAINRIASELVGKQHATDRSEDKYFELTEKAFGENHKDVIVELENTYKDHLTDDTKAFLDNASNSERVAFDQTVKSIMDAKNAEIAELKKEYGIEETGLQGEGESATTKVSIDDKISEKRKAINEMNTQAGQKDWAAINKAKEELKELYTKKVKSGK